MRVRILVVLILIAALVLFITQGNDNEPAGPAVAGPEDATGRESSAPPPPSLTAAAAVEPSEQPAARAASPPGEDSPPSSDGAVVVVAPPTPPALDKKAMAKAIEATRDKLRGARPIRTAWSDVPLPDVLRQLSEAAGMTIALGPGAMKRAADIKVAEPLATSREPTEGMVWDILEALAAQHELRISVGPKDVLLADARDTEKPRLRYFDVKGLSAQPWGNRQGLEKEDRLGAVLPELIREAAGIQESDSGATTIEAHNGILIARQKRKTLARIDDVLKGWREEPAALQRVYEALIIRRHPTVSGAPPRIGEGEEASGTPGK